MVFNMALSDNFNDVFVWKVAHLCIYAWQANVHHLLSEHARPDMGTAMTCEP